ncbi:hypothetical protein DFH11DRAFT_19506 [Phellopilus nigrolimitatus]|nr:hypothetical protein DFH11DRAFT_19506 [Phellopilus nigrolimitatus]
MDVASVRAEIKTWERAFKAGKGRDPSIEDIKAHPDIAAKYKLHKKLSKMSSSFNASSATRASAPSTPPRRSPALPGPSSLVPKTRAIQTFVDPSTVNPFSPTKSPRKKIAAPVATSFDQPRFIGPPATPPTKKRVYSTPSPEPFPLIQPSENAAEPDVTPDGNSVVKKARKRLRGDAVSPSPNRLDKKRRTAPVRAPAGASYNPALSTHDSDIPEEDEADPSYVIESPVKSVSNGKDFKLLFEDERLPKLNLSCKNGHLSRSQSFFAPFEKRANGILPQAQSIEKGDPVKRTQSVGQNKFLSGSKKGESSRKGVLKPVAPGKQAQLFLRPLGQSNLLDTLEDAQETDPTHSSRKRSSSDEEDPELPKNESISTAIAGELLPPSPPPSGPVHPGSRGGNTRQSGRGAPRNRKKAKMLVDTEGLDDITEDEENGVRIVEFDLRSRRRFESHAIVGDEDDEVKREVFGLLGVSGRRDISGLGEDESEGSEPEVNLPEDLRKVLYISSTHSRDREERSLVESLLHGGPSSQDQRGEVWGIGEVDETAAAITDGEDDWAGEGIPWEVGEL